MRRTIFVLSILIVFSSLARMVWVESEILAEAYEIQRLRQLDGRNDNDIRRLEAAIAAATSQTEIEKMAGELDFVLAAPRLLPRPQETISSAAH